MSAQTSNPSHLLLSRNPRSPAHPQLAPTWTSRHAQSPSQHSPSPGLPGILGWTPDDASASGRTRASSAPLPPLETISLANDSIADDEVIAVHTTFLAVAAFPGRVKVVVGRYEFWCHKEVLWFASPFFQALLQGSWAETQPDTSPPVGERAHPSHRDSILTETSTTDTDRPLAPDLKPPHMPSVSSGRIAEEAIMTTPSDEDGMGEEEGDMDSDHPRATASVYLDASEDGPSVAEILRELRELPDPASPPPSSHAFPSTTFAASHMSLPGNPPITPLGDVAFPSTPNLTSNPVVRSHSAQPADSYPDYGHAGPAPVSQTSQPHSRRRSSNRRSISSGVRPPSITHLRASAGRSAAGQGDAEAVVELHEESAGAFQDFLFWAYPHLECKVTWTNVENLLALAYKLLVPALQKLCEHFLLTHASGRPVMALALAEEHGHAELFREASRFVLDQPTWNPEELEALSEQTQLRLSQRRTWFLERLLKLGTIDVRKEYTCRPDCPDPARCQAQLDEKWRQAHSAVCRYGPPQPSVAFRCLRQLETFPTNPSLVMSHPLCQSAAKSWCMTLFDRMFQPKVVANPLTPGTEKYWLLITIA